MKRIAVIGSGITGLGAAYALKDTADITIFESRDRAGGHAHTIDVDYDGHPLAVDVGFIVYNQTNYPNLVGFFDALGVETQKSDMSFAVSNPQGFEWASSAKGLFADKRNLFRPRFHNFWRTILKFNDIARAELDAGEIGDAPLGFWLEKHEFSDDFIENYVLPMGGAIWSTPEAEMLDYPALSFFKFFDNHRLMHKERPKWRTVTGGSRTYVNAVSEALGARLRLSTPIESVEPFGNRVMVKTHNGANDVFDEVIMATHADTTRELLKPSYENLRFLLGSVGYRDNIIYVHRDPKLMPARKAAWASWNVLKQDQPEICLSYWMNRLQALPEQLPLFVTLNPKDPPAEALTFGKMAKAHPQFDSAAQAAVRGLKRQQGEDHIWVAGAWMGNGFHEDGLLAGLNCALSLGGRVPWQTENTELVPPLAQNPKSDTIRLGVAQS
ncbi:MAG: FAD-dependent oxidoreductase [Pseudomonadota bacterium]